jgi:hypothetical protein
MLSKQYLFLFGLRKKVEKARKTEDAAKGRAESGVNAEPYLVLRGRR